MFKEMHKNLKVRLIEIILVSCLNNMVYPFLAIYFAKNFGEALSGILLVSISILGVLAGFYGGHLGDLIGRRKILLFSESMRFLAFVVMTFANSPWFHLPWITFVMMAVNNMSWGVATPALDAMIIDASTQENREFYYTYQYWTINIAMVVGTTLGGFLFFAHPFIVFSMVGLGSLFSIVLLLFFIKETYIPTNDMQNKINLKPAVPKMKRLFTTYKFVFKDKTFITFIIASLLIYSIETQARSYAGVRLSNEYGKKVIFSMHHWSLTTNGVQMFGIINAENSLIVILLALFVRRLFKKFANRLVLYFGTVLFGLGYAIIGISNSAYLLILMMFVATIGELMWVPVQQSIMSGIPPEENRSSYMAINAIVGYGPGILGSLAVTIGAFLPPWAMGIIFMSCSLIAIIMCERSRKQLSERSATYGYLPT